MPANGHIDLRRWEREVVAIPVGLVLNGDNSKPENSTASINFSLSGVSIRTRLALVAKQELEIVINGGFFRVIPARVVWARQENSGLWTVAGLKFLPYAIRKAA